MRARAVDRLVRHAPVGRRAGLATLLRYQAEISMIYQKDIDTGFIRLIRADTPLIRS